MSHNPSILSHVSLGTNDYQAARKFYEDVLGSVGYNIIMEHGEATAFGKEFPEFWIHPPLNGEPATVGNGSHVSFMVDTNDLVHTMYDAAIAAGATDEGAPGPRPQYGDGYYGAFMRDLDGHKIEVMCWTEK